MKFHIVIPARLESSRLPRKLLLSASGSPLICHTARRALSIIDSSPELFSGITIAADDQEIITALAPLTQEYPDRICAVMTDINHQCGSDRIAEAVQVAGIAADSIINIQGDEPEIPVATVTEFARFITTVEDFQMATLAYPLTDTANICNPNLVKVVLNRQNRALYFSRAPIPYSRNLPEGIPAKALGHIGIYAYKPETLKRFVELEQTPLEKSERLEQLRALENAIPIAVQVLAHPLPKGIDTQADYQNFLERLKPIKS